MRDFQAVGPQAYIVIPKTEMSLGPVPSSPLPPILLYTVNNNLGIFSAKSIWIRQLKTRRASLFINLKKLRFSNWFGRMIRQKYLVIMNTLIEFLILKPTSCMDTQS